MTKSMLFTAAVSAALLLAGCAGRQAPQRMATDLSAVRAMVAQGSLMAAQAACTGGGARSDLIKGATALLRRATSGPEMNRIHKAMGAMNMSASATTGGGKAVGSLTPQQRLHIAVHAAGGDAFDLLDALARPGSPACSQVTPVGLAASAALLRLWHEKPQASDQATRMLDQEVDRAALKLADGGGTATAGTTPDVVSELAAVLGKI